MIPDLAIVGLFLTFVGISLWKADLFALPPPSKVEIPANDSVGVDAKLFALLIDEDPEWLVDMGIITVDEWQWYEERGTIDPPPDPRRVGPGSVMLQGVHIDDAVRLRSLGVLTTEELREICAIQNNRST